MSNGRFELYRSGIIRKGWRWRYRAPNGLIIFASTESYINKEDCRRVIPTLAGMIIPIIEV